VAGVSVSELWTVFNCGRECRRHRSPQITSAH
jgi:hypothetical protein